MAKEFDSHQAILSMDSGGAGGTRPVTTAVQQAELLEALQVWMMQGGFHTKSDLNLSTARWSECTAVS